MNKFFIFSDGLNKFGPFSKEEIEKMMFENKLYLTDMIFDIRTKQWAKILLHPDFVDDTPEVVEASDGIAGLMPDRATVDGDKIRKEGVKDLAIKGIIDAAKKEEKAKQKKVFTILQEGMTHYPGRSGIGCSIHISSSDGKSYRQI